MVFVKFSHVDGDGCVEDGVELAFTYVGNPQGNAIAERVIGTIKRECIWHHRSKNLAEAERVIIAFVEKYNTKRRHSSLGYRTPARAYEDWIKEAAIGT